MPPINGVKPQPATGQQLSIRDIPNTAATAGFSPDDMTAVQQAALRSLGRAPATARETELVARTALPPERLSALGIGSQGGDMARTGVMMDQAASRMGFANEAATAFKSEARAALPVLEEALKMATGVGNEKLGMSELFEKAGLTGFSTLSQSLNERVSEIADRSNSFRTVMDDVFNKFQGTNSLLIDNAKNALAEYEALAEQYNFAQDQLFELEKMKQNYEYDLQLAMEKAKLDAAQARRSQDPGSLFNGYQMLTDAGGDNSLVFIPKDPTKTKPLIQPLPEGLTFKTGTQSASQSGKGPIQLFSN